jgi:hypothetical protein
MADRVITATVELGLGGSFLAQVLAETTYKFWDMVPIANDTAIRQRMSTGAPPAGWSSGDTLVLVDTVSPATGPGILVSSDLPEGGFAVSLNGTSQYMASNYDETAAPGDIGPHTLEVVLIIQSLPVAGQEPAVMAGSTKFGVTAKNDGRIYGYYNGVAVVDLPFTLNTTLHVVLTRTDASPDSVVLYVNGASDSASVANADINRGYVHFGKHWSVSQYLQARYSFAAFYPRAFSSGDVALRFATISWTDVSDDVMVEPSLTIDRGIRDDNPLARVASTGTCTFGLDNGQTNSSGLLGYYSPEHANVRDGFVSGIPIRVLVDDDTSEYEIFHGRVQTIAPVPGVDGVRNTLIVATDLLDDIARFRLNQVPLLEDVRGNQVFRTLVEVLPNQPNGVSTTGNGGEIYPLALDNTRDEEVTMLQEFQRLAVSEFGRIWVNRVGALIYENRPYRSGLSVSLSLQDTQIATLDVADRTRDALNRVEVTVHPRIVDDASTTILFSLNNPLEIAAGETKVILGPYRVETAPDTIVRVGGLDLIDPIATTDYLMNSLQDGTGTNLTASLGVVANYGANGVQYRLTNNSGGIGFVTKLQARGRGVYDFRTVVVEATDDEAIVSDGVNSIAIDMPYQEDADVAQTIADDVLAAYGPIITRPLQVSLYVNDADLGGILGHDISTRISITEQLTNLSSKQAFINGIRFELIDGTLGVLTWRLAPPEDTL